MALDKATIDLLRERVRADAEAAEADRSRHKAGAAAPTFGRRRDPGEHVKSDRPEDQGAPPARRGR
ncbi:MAG: hypothetical protein ACXWK7_11540, partial [Caulobacteraceae bacterium]